MGIGGYYDPDDDEITTFPTYNDEEKCGNCMWWNSREHECKFGSGYKEARDYCTEDHFSHK